jgi:hypothetical protein
LILVFQKLKSSPTDRKPTAAGCQRIKNIAFLIRWSLLSVGDFGAALIIGFSFFVLSCGHKTDSSPVLARVEKAAITQRQYEWRFKNLAMLTPIDNAPMREALLQAMIDEQVLLIEADHRGLRETDEFKRRAEGIRLDAILEAYRDSIADTVSVQENEIKEAFLLASEQAAARHLFAPTLAEANALTRNCKTARRSKNLRQRFSKTIALPAAAVISVI